MVGFKGLFFRHSAGPKKETNRPPFVGPKQEKTGPHNSQAGNQATPSKGPSSWSLLCEPASPVRMHLLRPGCNITECPFLLSDNFTSSRAPSPSQDKDRNTPHEQIQQTNTFVYTAHICNRFQMMCKLGWLSQALKHWNLA